MRRLFSGLLFTPLFIFSTPASALIPQIERDALNDLYQATAGDSWHNNSGWNELSRNEINSNECNWFGVSCNVTETSITGLQLNANNLRGPLPASIVNLSNITHINIDYNAVYSDSQTVNDFINASSELNYTASQTLDVNDITFSSITANSLQIDWPPVGYLNDEGGYRVYLAEQVDSEAASITSDFIKQTDDIVGKTNTTITLNDLSPCRQYFVKVVSYTNPHAANNTAIESDGFGGVIMGTIPGFESNCVITGSPYNDAFSITQITTDLVTTEHVTTDLAPVIIRVSDTGERDYQLTGTDFFHIDGAAGQDSLTVLGSENTAWTLSGNNSGDVNGNTFSSIEVLIGQSSSDTLVGLNTANEWSITETNTGTLNESLSFSSIENLVGGSDIDTFIISPDVIIGSIDGGESSLDIISVISEPQPGSTSCDSTNSATLSSGNFTTVSSSCSLVFNPSDLTATTLDNSTIEISTGPPSQEVIDHILTEDGLVLPTDDENTCTITNGQCIAEDGSVYVFSDGKLIKAENGSGSLDIFSLFLFILYSGFVFYRKEKLD